MRKKWKPCRLEETIHARLTEYANSLVKAKFKGRRRPLWKTHPLLTLSDAIGHLLDQVDNHRARSKRAQSKRKADRNGTVQANGNGYAELVNGSEKFTSTRFDTIGPPTL